MFAWIVIGAGVLLVLISAFADRLGLGRHQGFGWLQEVGVIIGLLVIMAGFYSRRGRSR